MAEALLRVMSMTGSFARLAMLTGRRGQSIGSILRAIDPR
jgi:hypothetical protein